MEGCRGGAWCGGRRKKEKTAKLSGDQERPETGSEHGKRPERGGMYVKRMEEAGECSSDEGSRRPRDKRGP